MSNFVSNSFTVPQVRCFSNLYMVGAPAILHRENNTDFPTFINVIVSISTFISCSTFKNKDIDCMAENW